MVDYKDIVGRKFGKVLVLEYLGQSPKNQLQYYSVQCDCGKISKIHRGTLTRKDRKNQSCGCTRYKNHKKQKESKYFFKSFLHKYKCHSKKRGHEFNLSLDDLDDQYDKQNGLCYFSGIELILPKFASNAYKTVFYDENMNFNPQCRNLSNISIDRIDNSLGYNKGNIVLVTKDINIMKNLLSANDFIKLCHLVSKSHLEPNIDIPHNKISMFSGENLK